MNTLSDQPSGQRVVILVLSVSVMAISCTGMPQSDAAAASTELAASTARQAAAFPDPIVLMTTDVLENLLDDPGIRVVDARDSKEYQEGHIPGAVNLPASSLADAESRIKGNLFAAERLAAKFRLQGIGRDTHVVVYDAQGGRLAARVLWVLHYLGHPTVSVLETGLTGWREENRPVTQEPVQTARKDFPVDPISRRLATADWILDHMQDPDVVLVDARPRDLHDLDHIPGSVNIPWTDVLNADESWWKSNEELTRIFEAAGVTRDKNVVIYAEVGGMSSLAYLILRSLGYPRVRTYDRSWAEWASDMSLPRSGKTSPRLPVLKAVFRANGCAVCHRTSAKPKEKVVGFTDKGLAAGDLESGCVSLLTKIMKMSEGAESLPPVEKETALKSFDDHGCAKCHAADGSGATSANLNKTGQQFQGMNLGCVDMMFVLAG